MSRRHAPQPDLFGAAAATVGHPRPVDDEAARDEADLMAALRERLAMLLEKVTTAERLPFRDATQALIAELEFARGVLRLPRAEAEPMHTAFNDAMWRLYAIDEGMIPPPPRPEGWCRMPLDDPRLGRTG